MMANHFKREPFVRLPTGSCKYHGERDAVYRLFLPHLDPMNVCRECYEYMTEDE